MSALDQIETPIRAMRIAGDERSAEILALAAQLVRADLPDVAHPDADNPESAIVAPSCAARGRPTKWTPERLEMLYKTEGLPPGAALTMVNRLPGLPISRATLVWKRRELGIKGAFVRPDMAEKFRSLRAADGVVQ